MNNNQYYDNQEIKDGKSDECYTVNTQKSTENHNKRSYDLLSLILGVLSIFINFLAIPGMIFGILDFVKNKKQKIKTNAKTIAGIVCSSIGMIFFIIFTLSILFSIGNSNKYFEVNEVVSQDGVKFIPNIENVGTIVEDVNNINSDFIRINDKEYKFPKLVSELISDGWVFSSDEFSNNIKANTITTLLGRLELISGNSIIDMIDVVNQETQPNRIQDCKLRQFRLACDNENMIKFVLPGGINEKSTAHDILSVYGDPNNSELFNSGSNDEYSLNYISKTSYGYNYNFIFNDDGTLKHVDISANAYK